VEKKLYNLLAQKPFSLMSQSELDFVEKAGAEPSGGSFISDLKFLESNSEDFVSYKTFDKPSVNKFTKSKKNTLAKSLALVLILAIASMLSFFFFYGDNTPNAQYQFALLPDGTEIQLIDGASYSIDEKSFLENREVRLKGNAFFDVSRNEDVPFNVRFDDINITVLGTSFYINENTQEIHVMHGKVKVSNDNADVILTMGESLIYADNKLEIKELDQPRAKLFSGQYQNEPLSNVIKDISQFLGIEIISTSPIGNCSYTGEFNAVTAKEALDELSILFHLEVIYEQDKVSINTSVCN
jgi:ferric-dicitrate binding protein FerR (iron transport regulator)